MGRTLIWIVVVAGLGAAGWFLLGDDGGGEGPILDEDLRSEAGEDGPAGPGLQGAGTRAGTPAPTTVGRYEITGQVVDEADKGLADIAIEVRASGKARDAADPSTWGPSLEESIQAVLDRHGKTPEEQRPVVARATTTADGSFRVKVPAYGSYRVHALPDAPQVATYKHVKIYTGHETDSATLLVLTGSPLHGRIVDANDKPLEGTVRASLSEQRQGQFHSWFSLPAKTEGGVWRLPAVMHGSVRLSARLADGRRVTGITVETPRKEAFVIRVASGEGSIGGLVSDAAGAPVAGALIALGVDATADESAPAGRIHLVAKTGADGRYMIPGSPPGKIQHIEAVATGFLPYVKRAGSGGATPIDVGADGTATVDVKLLRGGTVVGKLTETGGKTPIAGGTVTLYKRSSQGQAASGAPPRATTDAAGRFTFKHVAQGTYVALPEAKGYFLPQVKPGGNTPGMAVAVEMGGPGGGPPTALTVIMTDEGHEVERNLELGRGHDIKGRVVDAEGQGIAEAEVFARGYGLQQVAWQWGIGGRQNAALATTDGTGQFEASGLPPHSEWVLYAKKEGYAGVYTEPFALGADQAATDLKLQLIEGAILRGKVTGLDPSELGTANVGFWGQGQELAAKSWGHKLKPDGTFEITGIPAGDWSINVWAGGRQSQQKPIKGLKAGEVREGIVIELKGGVEVSGRVIDKDGEPVAGLNVSINTFGRGGWFTSQTDKSGAFVFRSVAKGRCQLMTWGSNGRQVALGTPFEAPGSDLELTYDRPKRVTLRGKVEASDGTKIAVCRVSVSAGGGARPGMAPAPMMPGGGAQDAIKGEFEIQAEGEGPWHITASAARGEDGSPLNLQTGRAEVSDPNGSVVVRMEPGMNLSGRVVDAAGKGLAGIRVQAGSRGAVSEKDGSFTIAGLGKGKQIVMVQPPPTHVRPQPLTVDAGDKDIVITLTEGLKIGGTVLGADGKPVKTGYAQASWQKTGEHPQGAAGGQVKPGGTFEVTGIPPGARVRVQVQVFNTGGGTAYAPAVIEDVAPGTMDLELRLGGGLSIQGKVLDEEGKPPSQCFVYGRTKDGRKQTGWVQVDEKGEFTLAGLEAVPYDVRVMRQDGGAAPPPVTITPPRVGLVIQLPRTTSIRGTVTGVGASEAQGWRIRVWNADGHQVGSATTATDGSWEIPRMAEADEIFVGATRGDARYARVGPIKPGKAAISLPIQAGRSISGRIEGVVENERVRGNVSATGADGWLGYGKIEKDGSFVIQGLPPGQYVVKATAYGVRPKSVDQVGIRDGTDNVRLDLR